MRSILTFVAFSLLYHFGHAQCSSSLNTPEFPIATHPADGHTQSWGANIFTPAQFGPATNITGIQVYVDNSFGPTTYASQQIWMRHTAVASYPSAAYPTTTGFTQVYSGTYNFPMSGLVTLPFNVSAFAYNGSSNVEVLFENRSNVYRANEPWFRRTATYGAGVFRSKWNGNFGFGGFPGTGSNGSAVRLTYTLSLTAVGGGGCGSVLPVSLRFFGAEPTSSGILLAWEPGQDAVGTTFALERSANGIDFAELLRTTSLTFLDQAPVQGLNYYRLRMWDQDGVETVSGIIETDSDAPMDNALHFIRKSGGGLQLAFLSAHARECHVEIWDLQGKKLVTTAFSASQGWNSCEVEAISLPEGILVARVVADGQTWVGRGTYLR